MNKVYTYVTERIINLMQSGIIPWQKGWTNSPAINYITRKPYRGVNRFLLFKGGEYLTFRQVQALGGRVKKGAKSYMVVFYTSYTKTRKGVGKDGEETEITETIPVLRYYNVFHLSEVEGIPTKLEQVEHEPIKEAEEIIAGYKSKPAITFDDSDRAYYRPVQDIINVPSQGHFKSVEEYYSTLFHELVHSTGHQKRLARFGNSPDEHMFGSESYSKEELVAELGAAMLCGHCGIVENTIKNSAAYVQSWINVLNDDKTLIVHAASAAQKAADYILGKNEKEGEND